MVGDAELLLDQPCDALASPQGRGIAVCLGAVEQPLLQLRQLLGAELWLAPGATRMSQRLGAALQRLLCPAADALLRDAEAAGDSGLVRPLSSRRKARKRRRSRALKSRLTPAG